MATQYCKYVLVLVYMAAILCGANAQDSVVLTMDNNATTETTSDSAVVQPFIATSNNSIFVNEATATPAANEATATTSPTVSDFHNTEFSAADEERIIGNLEAASDAAEIVALSAIEPEPTGGSTASNGLYTADALSGQGANTTTGSDTNGSSAATLSGGVIACLLVVVGVVIAVRRRRMIEARTPGTPKDMGNYFHCQRQLTPPPV